MKKQRHKIKRQILELQLESREKAIYIQNRAGRVYRDKLIPIIDECCNELSHPDVVYKVDRLELDLGNINLRHLEKEMTLNLGSKLRRRLSEKIKAAERVSKSFSPHPVHSSGAVREEKEKTISELALFEWFVQKGNLPPDVEKIDDAELENILERLIINSPNPLKKLIFQLVENKTQLKRLIFHFSDDIMARIIQMFPSGPFRSVLDFKDDMKQILEKTQALTKASKTKVRLGIWMGIFKATIPKKPDQPERLRWAEKVIIQLADNLGISHQAMVIDIYMAAGVMKKEGVCFKTDIHAILSEIHSEIKDPSYRPKMTSQFHRQTDVSIFDSGTERDKKNTGRPFKNETGAAESDDLSYARDLPDTRTQYLQHEGLNEIFIENSGLILLWPFLAGFFKALGFIKDKRFVHLEFAWRAAILLQYLSDGPADLSDHNLSLNKVLCGLDIMDPIETGMPISGSEQAECEELLVAVIHNWAILKRMSIPGFQQAFLQRQGILSGKDAGWFLQVERKTHDVVMDKLPWSINIVKLPWMEKVLVVEW
jgi:hypothetical protein